MANKTVFIIKSVHLVLFIFMAVCLFYIIYCITASRYDWTLLTAMAVILFDGLSIVLNRGRCPLTTLAEKYGAENGAVTDIILTKWCARYVFKFFTVVFAIELIFLGVGYFA